MTNKEYSLVKDMSAKEYSEYLANKNGRPTKKFASSNRSERLPEGLIRHHELELLLPRLSMSFRSYMKAIEYARQHMDIKLTDDEIARIYKASQEPEHLIYCTKEQHTLLHNKIRDEYPELRQLSKLIGEYENNHKRVRVFTNRYVREKDYSEEVIIKSNY